jgi:tRNA G46 methylase TrmB
LEGISRQVQSPQPWIHAGLVRLVRRHAAAPWQKPPQAADGEALDTLRSAIARHRGPLVLDSFCGTGTSTAKLANRNPAALVVGIDKSAHRLRRAPQLPPNCLLLRAHCEAIWRELVTRGIHVSQHYLLYPNPWPKSAHLARRVHGHPAFPLLITLGGDIELRSNWQIYVEEFGVALHLLGHPSRIASVPDEEAPLSPFERKYRDSGHTLWKLRARLGNATASRETAEP